ncbi:MAG TPA: hypothetical protein DIW51_13705 [Rhodospirillaceae bacterium]|nr:hypothetical protein [Magnetovibrio sp.]HBT41293.1 hypothetical protein [Rhodospirillaceae bacterium]HCS71012.1 hypothetical protein [Rhodospirillaceae bacterium]
MNSAPAPWPDDRVILYDGACVLCSGWVRFVVHRDAARQFRFTPIESPYGKAMADALNIDPANPDTNAVIMDGRALRRSDAALAVVSALPGWRWTRLLRIVPRGVRDALYDIVARNRYRLFGRNDFCDLGGADLEGRVLTCTANREPAASS